MRAIIELLLLGGAGVGAFLALRGLRRAPGYNLVVTGGVLATLTSVALVASSVLTSFQATLVAAGVTTACVLLDALSPTPSGKSPAAATVTVATVTCYLFAINAVLNQDISLTTTFGRLSMLFVWCFFLILVRNPGFDRQQLATSVILIFHASVLLGSMDPWDPCSTFKCGPLQQLYVGPFESENFMARLACLALLLALPARRTPLGVATLPIAAVIVYLSASRTSQLALLVALAAWWTWRFVASSNGRHRYGVAAISTIALTAIGASLVHGAEPSDFSNRGRIWLAGLRHFDSWGTIFGHGIDAWSTEVLARNYMHSQYLLLLFSGGLIAVALHCIVVTILGARALSFGGAGAAILAMYLVSGLVETAWNPVALDAGALLFFVLAAYAFTGAQTRTIGAASSLGGCADGLATIREGNSDQERAGDTDETEPSRRAPLRA